MMENDIITIIPEPIELAPLELIIAEFLQADLERRESEMFEQLETERCYQF